MSDSVISFGLYLTYGMLGFAAIAAIIFPLVYLAKNPKSAKSVLAGAGALLALFGISYGLAGSEVLPSYIKYGVEAGGSKFVSAGLIAFYILFICAFVAAIFSEVSKSFK